MNQISIEINQSSENTVKANPGNNEILYTVLQVITVLPSIIALQMIIVLPMII